MPKQPKTVDFEKTLNELEQLVERMENGELTLEETLKSFERGIELSRVCQQAIDDAEQKVRVLTETEGKSEARAFDVDGQ